MAVEVKTDDLTTISNGPSLTKSQKKKNRKKAKKKAENESNGTPLPTYPIDNQKDKSLLIPFKKPIIPSSNDQKIIIQRLFQQSKSHGMTVGERFYVLNLKWFENWCNYVNYNDIEMDRNETIHLKPFSIDNTNLLDTTAGEIDDVMGLPLIQNLVKEIHFILVPREVWDALVIWYGGGPSICRFVVEIGNSIDVELYPGIDEMENEILILKKPKHCMVCHLPSKNCCSFCKYCIYCSKECQLAHWKYHKIYCKKIKLNNLNNNLNNYLNNSIEIYGKQGKCGLKNLGNTCFMNAAIQCLSHTEKITFYFLNNKYQNDLNTENVLGTGGKLAIQYALLLKELWFGTSSNISPIGLKRAISTYAPQFSGYQQHDGQELIAYLLDGLHEDINRIKNKPYIEIKESNGNEPDHIIALKSWENHILRNNSIFVEELNGQFKSKVVCPKCNKISITFDIFNCIQLEIPNENKRNFEIIIMPELTNSILFHSNSIIQPMKYKIQIDKNGTIKNIKMELIKIGCKYINMVLCDIFNHLIYRILPDTERLIRIRPDDRLIIYPQPSKTSACILFLSHRFCNKKKEIILFGDPLLLSLDITTTFDEFLTDLILKLIPMFGWSIEERKNRLHDATLKNLIANHIYLTNQDGVNINNNAIFNLNGFNNSAYVISTLSLNSSGYMGINWENQLGDLYNLPEPYVLSHISLNEINKNKRITLDDCFKKFIYPEVLDNDNLWYCNNCKKHQKAIKTIQFFKLPNILILSLKRFEYQNNILRDKINLMVDFPLENLNMEFYSLNKDNNLIYDLYAITNHYGTMEYGHYTAFAKNNNLWYSFDDSTVKSISSTNVVSNAAYILFYKRRNNKK